MVDEERVVTRSERVESATVPPPGYVRPASAATYSESSVAYRASGRSVLERAIIFLFGLIQGLIVLRIILLLLAARQGNDLVALIYNVSDVFVGPFRGILRIDEVAAGQSAFDVSAVIALIGWTILELLIIALLRVFRRTA